MRHAMVYHHLAATAFVNAKRSIVMRTQNIIALIIAGDGTSKNYEGMA